MKSSTKRLFSKIPSDIRARLLRHLINDEIATYDDLLSLARRFNVSELTVCGAYGSFRSTSSDTAVIGEYARTGTWAAETNRLFREFFAHCERGTYIDIGANIGLTTIPIAQKADVRCIAIEPEPTNFRNLEHNIAANCYFDNVTALQTAVSFERSIVEFELATGNLGDHRLRTKLEPGALFEHKRPTIMVQTATLDELIPLSDGPLAVKIDTQGAEPFVIAGGRKTLGRASLLVLEFWPYGMNRLGSSSEDVIAFLESRFKVTHLLGEGEALGAEWSTAGAIAELRRMATSKVYDQNFYVDIVATQDLPQ